MSPRIVSVKTEISYAVHTYSATAEGIGTYNGDNRDPGYRDKAVRDRFYASLDVQQANLGLTSVKDGYAVIKVDGDMFEIPVVLASNAVDSTYRSHWTYFEASRELGPYDYNIREERSVTVLTYSYSISDVLIAPAGTAYYEVAANDDTGAKVNFTFTNGYRISVGNFVGEPPDVVESWYDSKTSGLSYFWTNYEVYELLFDDEDNTVDFRALTSDQLDSIGYNEHGAGSYGDSYYNAQAGGDVVTLPDSEDIGGGFLWDFSETFWGGDGDDRITGGAGQDRINGGRHRDTLYGRGKADTLHGGDGNDDLYGGAGNDILIGGKGSDSFAGIDISAVEGDGSRQTGQNTINGEDYDDLKTVDRVVYASSYAAYNVRFTTAPDNTVSKSWVATVSTATGNRDEVRNWNLLNFSDVTVREVDLYKAGLFAYAVWGTTEAFEALRQYFVLPSSISSTKYKTVVKWLELGEKGMDALGQALTPGIDAKNAAKVLVGKVAGELANQLVDPAVDKLKDYVPTRLMPKEWSDAITSTIDLGAGELKQYMRTAAVDAMGQALDRTEDIAGIDMDKVWSDWMAAVEAKTIELYRSLPGMTDPKQQFQNPNLSPDLSVPPQPAPGGTPSEGSDVIILQTLGSLGILDGGGGHDVIIVAKGSSSLIGRAGNDLLDGGVVANPATQGNYLNGGIGDDTYIVRNVLDRVDEGYDFRDLGFGGDDTIASKASWYWDIYGVAETLRIDEDAVDPAGAGTTIIGGVWDNTIIGNAGTNILFGRGGSDTFRAGDGIDYISLSLLGVPETLYAGVNGSNRIVVERRESGPSSYDIVFDFESGKDRLDVSDYSYGSVQQVIARGHNDGAGSSYFALGDGLDYIYLVGRTLAQISEDDFII